MGFVCVVVTSSRPAQDVNDQISVRYQNYTMISSLTAYNIDIVVTEKRESV